MIIFDSNTFIYGAENKINLSLITKSSVGYASISAIEVLGYHQITAASEYKLGQILDCYHAFELTSTIVQRAIQLRQLKKMSLGDAIIAATALENDCELWTANTKDFAHIDDLRLHNPVV
jgi:hypothetical protein